MADKILQSTKNLKKSEDVLSPDVTDKTNFDGDDDIKKPSGSKRKSSERNKNNSSGGGSCSTSNTREAIAIPSTRLASYKAKKSAINEKEKDDVLNKSSVGQSSSDAILAVLKTIQDNQMRQGDALKELTDRVDSFDFESNEYENDLDYEDYCDEIEDTDFVEPPLKKQKPDCNNNPLSGSSGSSRFSAMSKRCRVQETFDDDIDELLASNINDLFRNGMNEEQYNELTKDETTPRPGNCEGLSVVRTNQLIWNVISPMAQTADKKLQFIEKSVIKAATILTKSVNNMDKNQNKILEGSSNLDLNEFIDSCNDVLALLGHCNRQINMARRDFLKPEIMHDYLHLCSSSVPYTKFLFGDDVSKTAKDIEDCSRVGNRLRSGRGRGTYRGVRGIRRSRRGSFRSFRGGSGRGLPNYRIPRNSNFSKNSQRGASQAQN